MFVQILLFEAFFVCILDIKIYVEGLLKANLTQIRHFLVLSREINISDYLSVFLRFKVIDLSTFEVIITPIFSQFRVSYLLKLSTWNPWNCPK